jgi:hypothetical protein
MVLHREATGVEKEVREEESQDVAIEDKAAWFKSTYHFALFSKRRFTAPVTVGIG